MNEWRGVLVMSLPLLLGMRDPFLPAEDSCAASQVTLWQYRGVVSRGEQRTAIVTDASGKWRRLAQGQKLDNGWRVTAIQPQQMDMAADAGCEPSQWRWQREGKQNDAKVSGGMAADSHGRRGKRAPGVADGR